MWFTNKRDEGVMYYDDFKPFPVVAFALVLTAASNIFFFMIAGSPVA